SYRGKFLNMNVETYLKFSADDKLINQQILWGWNIKGVFASDELIRKRIRALQEDPSIFILGEREREILKTGVKIRGLIVKQYGKPSMEEFVDGEGPSDDTLCYEGGGTVLTRKEALAAKTGNIHYTLRYKNKKTKRFSEETQYIKFCFNHLNGSLESWGPNYYDEWRK
ncbi:hypothetical protein OAE34_01260, partial [Akkermansiaceae bacterium]|nr:hypothetical protein [Akkermansiaceae bacterium]